MYVQCYDKRGNRHNFNVIGDDMDAVRKHVESKGYTNVAIVPFYFKG